MIIMVIQNFIFGLKMLILFLQNFLQEIYQTFNNNIFNKAGSNVAALIWSYTESELNASLSKFSWSTENY